MSTKERTNVFPDAAKSLDEPSCNVSTSILRRWVWRIRDLFARSYVFMKSTIAIDMYNMYRMYDHRTGLAESRRSNAEVLETVNARGCTSCQERIAFMWKKRIREIGTKKEGRLIQTKVCSLLERKRKDVSRKRRNDRERRMKVYTMCLIILPCARFYLANLE